MTSDAKAWARKLVAEFECGRGNKSSGVYRMAYEALDLPFPKRYRDRLMTHWANVQSGCIVSLDAYRHRRACA